MIFSWKLAVHREVVPQQQFLRWDVGILGCMALTFAAGNSHLAWQLSITAQGVLTLFSWGKKKRIERSVR